MSFHLSELLDTAERLALKACDTIMAIYAREFVIEEKADRSPLTEADKAAHEVSVAGLNALPESIPVLSEEDTEGFADADANGRYWLVEPLDGTREFIKRNGEFTVNIALIENGRPVLGVPRSETPISLPRAWWPSRWSRGKARPTIARPFASPTSPRKTPTSAWWPAAPTPAPIWPHGSRNSAATIWCPWAAR